MRLIPCPGLCVVAVLLVGLSGCGVGSASTVTVTAPRHHPPPIRRRQATGANYLGTRVVNSAALLVDGGGNVLPVSPWEGVVEVKNTRPYILADIGGWIGFEAPDGSSVVEFPADPASLNLAPGETGLVFGQVGLPIPTPHTFTVKASRRPR